MSLTLVDKNNIDFNSWKLLSDNSTYSNFFQTVDCFRFYETLSFMEPFVFGVCENNLLSVVVTGYIITEKHVLKRKFSSRAIIPGGLLIGKNASNDAIFFLLDQLKNELKKKVIYTEIRNYADYSDYLEVFCNAGFQFTTHYNIHLPIENVDLNFSKLSKSKRRQIKLSQASGLTTVVTKDVGEVKQLYNILIDLYNHRIGKPIFDYEFFDKIVTHNFCTVIVVKNKENVVVGGMVLVQFNNKYLYEWFVCGLRMKSKTYPSVLATWSAIEYAINNNIEVFDFMGAGNDSINKGIRNFKSKFGGVTKNTGRFIAVFKPFVYLLGKLYTGFLSNLLKMNKQTNN